MKKHLPCKPLSVIRPPVMTAALQTIEYFTTKSETRRRELSEILQKSYPMEAGVSLPLSALASAPVSPDTPSPEDSPP